MIDTMVHRIVNGWISAGITSEDERDIYEYGLELLIFSFVNMFAVMVTALLMGKVQESLLMLAVIIPLQSFGGGFHAKTHLRCFLIMYIGWWVSVLVLPWITAITATILTVLSVCAVFLLAPVPHENVPMSGKQRGKMRRFARTTGGIIGALSLLFIWAIPSFCHAGIVLSMGLGAIMVSMATGRIAYTLRTKDKEGVD